MAERLGHTGRAPLCPECGYNLVATLDAGWRRCPECGCEFEPHEVRRQPAPHDWTLWRGVQNASITLFLRSAIVFIACGIGVFALDRSLAFVLSLIRSALAVIPLLLLLVVLLIAGLVIGKFISRDADELFGIKGVIPALFATVFCWAALVAGIVTAEALFSFYELAAGPMLLVTGATATITIIRYTIFADF